MAELIFVMTICFIVQSASVTTIFRAHKQVIQFLLSKGANPTLTNSREKTSLEVACELGSLDSIFMLVQHG